VRRRSPRLELDFQVATRCRDLPAREDCFAWASAALEHDCRVALRIVGMPEGRALNRDFRARDYATNVLTFVYAGPPVFEGDLALCAPVVKREARLQGRDATAHWAHLVVHGMLHLQGYDHEDQGDAERMERREVQILGELGYPDPYRMAA